VAGRRAVVLNVLVAGCAALVTAGCGVVYSAAPGPASASPSPSPTATAGPAAYLACLRQHGVTIPAGPPSPGGGGGSASGPAPGTPAFTRAQQACAALRPPGGFFGPGGGFGQFGAALQSFRSCMAAHGEPVPATPPSAPPAGQPGPDRFLNGLNPANPGVAAALKACQSRLPNFGPPPAGHPGTIA
jgi:hypothetical protein